MEIELIHAVHLKLKHLPSGRILMYVQISIPRQLRTTLPMQLL